jgi:Domain of unknown function (DUF5666)
MRLVVLILSILAFGSLAAVEEQFTVIGTVDKISGNQILVKTSRGSFPISAADKTEVMKDKIYHDLSPLKVGDEISVRCKPDAQGKLVAINVWANVVNFVGTVQDVRGEEIEVVTNSGNERKVVRLYPDTAFSTSRKDLSVGQDVRIVGLDVGNGAIDASRVALYNTDVPLNKGPRK